MATYNTGFAAPVQNTPIISSLDYMYMPQVHKKLVSRHPGQYETSWLNEFGMKEKVGGQTYNWLENNLAFDAPTIGAIANESGNLMRITIASASHQNSGQFSYPRAKDVIRLLNGYEGLVQSKVTTTPNAHYIIVAPVKSSISYATFAAGVAANQQFFISGVASGEGVDVTRDSIIPTTSTFSNKLQKFTETYTVTFEDRTNEAWITFQNPLTGEDGKAVYYKGCFETEMRFQFGIENSTFLGQGSESGLTDVNGNPVSKTEGLLETCDTRATQLSYASSINTSFYENVRRIATRNHSGDEFLQLQGENFNLLTTNFLADWGKNGSIVYANSEAEKTIDAVFGSFNFGTLKVKFKDLGILNHNEMAGAPGFDYRDRAIFLPTQKKFNKKMGVDVPVFTLMYKEQYGQGASGHIKFVETGMYARSGATNTTPSQTLTWVADCGARTAGAKEIINVRKA